MPRAMSSYYRTGVKRLWRATMDKKVLQQLVNTVRQLVSDVQGAPYPGNFETELYSIWYEHAQRNAQNCLELLDENFPEDHDEFSKSLKKMFK